MVITTECTFILKRFDDCLSQLTYFTCLSLHVYIYIYITNSIYVYSIGQSFKEVKLGDIKNCFTLVVKVLNLKSITRRQNVFWTQLTCIQVILIVL